MDTKWVALGLYGLVAFQLGADPGGTQAGIKSAFTSANGVAKQIPVLCNSDGVRAAQPAPADDGMQLISRPDGRQVAVPAGYRVVPTGS